LFTWPSDGQALPYVSYKSDRSDAKGSGYAIGRGFLKLRDFLVRLRDEEDRWHPFLITLDSGFETQALKVQDAALADRSAELPMLEVVP